MASWDRNATAGAGTSSSTQANSQQTTQTNTSTSGSSSQNTNTTNMDPTSLAALQALISQLLGGGTQEQARESAARIAEQKKVGALRDSYSKESAFVDSQGAMNQLLRQAMESAMPSLVRAAEGSGTSANSMRALLTQDALTRASQGAAALGLDAATAYGTVGANYSSILEQLTRPNNSVTDALISALNVAKGAVTSSSTTGTSSQNQSSTGTTTGSTNQTTNTGQAQQFTAPSSGLSSYSANSNLGNLTNSQWNALANAAGGNMGWFNNSAWSDYTNF